MHFRNNINTKCGNTKEVTGAQPAAVFAKASGFARATP
jgi:hypothetical protein